MLKKLLVVGYCAVMFSIDASTMIPQEKGEAPDDRGEGSCPVSLKPLPDLCLVGTRRLVDVDDNPNFNYAAPEIAYLSYRIEERNNVMSNLSTVSVTSGSYGTTYPDLLDASAQGQDTLLEQK
ncbi:MAG: hypothetical protein K6C34_03250 [Alphaproteobacteria bacterium]|nr:hypothetical protein [Alphaproteobacteria bacterium]